MTRILVTLSRPKDALALLDEIITLRLQRDAAIQEVLNYQRILRIRKEKPNGEDLDIRRLRP